MRCEYHAVADQRAFAGDGVCDWGEGCAVDFGGLGGTGVVMLRLRGGVGGLDDSCK